MKIANIGDNAYSAGCREFKVCTCCKITLNKCSTKTKSDESRKISTLH